jgi:hypothetical protein
MFIIHSPLFSLFLITTVRRRPGKEAADRGYRTRPLPGIALTR